MQRLKNGKAEHGDIILSKYQSGGRGQAENTWYATDGKNLLMSIICKDIQVKASELPKLNILVSLAVFNLVNAYFENTTSVKWPNDILVDDKKIAGILVESILSGDFVKHVVIGIGLNVNEATFPGYLDSACSLYSLTQQDYDVEDILFKLIDQIDLQLSKLSTKKFDELRAEYEAVLYAMNAKRYFRSFDSYFEGKITGINKSGQLCIETTDGIETFSNKEIAFDFSKHRYWKYQN